MAPQRWNARGLADREGVDVNDDSKTQPQAIPTRYAGYHFRSRLEARWAVFFDALKVEWEYEPEGFDLPSGWYLPDFRVDLGYGEPTWFEVKGVEPSDREWHALGELCASTELWGIIVGPIPRSAFRDVGVHRTGNAHGPCKTCTCADPYGAYLPIFGVPVNPSGVRNPVHPRSGLQFMMYEATKVQTALDAARSARFEHGHSGAS